MSAMSEHTIDIEGRAPDEVIPPRELHHVTFKTNRIDEMVAFYETLTGHQARFHNAAFAAITFDGANHRMALLGLAPWTELPPEQALVTAGLHHVAYEYGSLDELLHTYLRVRRAGIEAEWAVNHGPTMSFYYRDPDGHGVELQADNCDHDPARWDEIGNGLFEKNQMGINVNVDKLVEARRRGVSEDEIARDSYNHRDNPYAAPGWGPPGLNLQPPPGLELPDVQS